MSNQEICKEYLERAQGNKAQAVFLAMEDGKRFAREDWEAADATSPEDI